MRFKSKSVSGVRVFAVAGVNTVSFGISASATARNGLLGFAVERVDVAADERYYMQGFKVFPSIIPNPDENTIVSTYEHPVQSLVWDDFTAKPDHDYTYVFHPLKGSPKKLDRSAKSVSIAVRTEPLYGGTHDVFFNRGVASSQAYAHRFQNLRPDEQPTAAKRQEALDWLSRDLDDAMVRFIRSAKKGDALRGCFYEFTYLPIAKELRAARTRGVDVELIIDCKVNEAWVNETQPDGTKKRVFHKSDPRLRNLDTVKDARLPDAIVHRREARRSDIAHNKFIVLLRGKRKKPTEVWTGSTNLTEGGIHGQANAGHWVHDADAAQTYFDYWTLLSDDPGGQSDDDGSDVRSKNKAFLASVAALTPTPSSVDDIVKGATPMFSPRSGPDLLNLYASLIDEANDLSCITFAFTIAKPFKDVLSDNTSAGPLCFLLLETKDAPNKRAKAPFVKLDARNNVYEAWGSELDTPLGQWTAETTTRTLGLNSHVSFIHCKFLLRDPLGADPIVVTGSANFSAASTNDNDENMLIVRGDLRCADIYFTEFNRLFNHYYFRSVVERTHRQLPSDDAGSLALTESDKWLTKYKPGTLRSKRVAQYISMANAELVGE